MLIKSKYKYESTKNMKMDTTCISKYNVFHQSLKHRFSEYFNFILFIKQIKEQNNQMHIKLKKKKQKIVI